MLAFQLEDEVSIAGHQVVGNAMTRSEAIDLAQSSNPDLILLDMQLADGPTGLGIALALADDPMMLVFVTASARDLPDDLGGALGVIDKPWSSRGLSDALGFLAQGRFGGVPPPPPGSLHLAPGCAPGADGLYSFG